MNRMVASRVAGILLAVPVFGAFAQAADQGVPVARLLPAETLFVVSSDDAHGYMAAAESLPLGQILREEEMVMFLEKPKAALRKGLEELATKVRENPGFENFELDVEQLTAGTYGRVFIALTHVTLPNPQAGEMVPDIGLVLGVEGRDGAPDWGALLKDVLGRAVSANGLGDVRFVPRQDGDVTYEVLEGTPDMGMSVAMGRTGDLQLFSLSTTSLRAILQRARGAVETGDTLAGSQRYGKAQENLAMEGAATMRLFVNAGNAMQLALEGIKMGLEADGHADRIPLVDQIFEKTGLGSLKSLAFAARSVDGYAHSRTFTEIDGPRTGFLDLTAKEPLDLGMLELAPQDVMSVTISKFLDLAKLYDMVLDIAGTVEPEVRTQIETGIAQFSAAISEDPSQPLSLRDDLLANLGPQLGWITPRQNNPMSPAYLFVMSTKDPGKVSSVLERLLAFASNQSAGAVAFNTDDYQGTAITRMDMAEQVLPFQPGLAMLGDKLMIAMSTGDIKRQVKRTQKPTPGVRENPDFQRFFAHVPQDAQLLSLSYTDMKASVEAGYGVITTFLPMLPMMMAGTELPVDPALLPAQETITKHLFGALSYGMDVDDGCLYESFSPLGGETIAAAAAGAAVAAVLVLPGAIEVRHGASEGMSIEAELPPEEIEPLEADPTEEAQAGLRDLRTAIRMYKLENGSPPATLEDLKTPSPSYPNGALRQAELPLDPWGQGYRYKVDGESVTIWSVGPNGEDEMGAGDDVVLTIH